MAGKGQQVVRLAGQTTCIHHQEKAFDFYCEKCKTLFCSICVTTIHKGHDFSDLSDVTRVYKTDIQRYVDDTEGNKLQQTQQKIMATEDDLKKNDEYFDNLTKEAKLQAEKLKKEIDVLTVETLSVYQQIKDENARILMEYKRCLEKGHGELGDHLEQCKTLLQEASDIQIYDARQEMTNRDVIFPPKPALSDVTFCPTTGYRAYLEQAFGKVTTSGQFGRPTTPDVNRSTGSVTVRNVPSTTPPSPGYSLLLQTKIQQEFRTEMCIYCMQSTGNDRALIWLGGCKYIALYSPTGDVLNTIKFSAYITDISVSPLSHNVWALGTDRSIMECIDGSPVVRFHADNTPICLCVTNSNHVLVGIIGRIIKYSPEGHVLLTTGASKSGQVLVHVDEPYSIAECCVTGNVAVVDRSTCNVLVMDKDFHEQFRYKGTNAPFNPWAVTYDSVGNIILSHYNNHCVILLNGDAQFIKVIHQDTDRPTAVSIDRDNVLWVALGSKVIKRLQYCSM